MKRYYTVLITMLSIITLIMHAKEELVVQKWEDDVATTRTASAKDWLIESVFVEKSNVPKDAIPYLGDYRVTVKIRNISKRPIKIATNWSFTSQICSGELSSKEMLGHFRESEFLRNQCCHPPEYIVVEPNQTYTGYCNNSSKYEGKKMNLVAPGMIIGSYTVKLGNYTLKQPKMESQQTNR